jgi:hypothetical protein
MLVDDGLGSSPLTVLRRAAVPDALRASVPVPVLVPPPPDEAGGYGDAIPFMEEDPSEVTQVTQLSDADAALGAYDAGVESAVELPPEEEISLTPSARLPVGPAVTASQYPVQSIPGRATRRLLRFLRSVAPASGAAASRAIPSRATRPGATAEPCRAGTRRSPAPEESGPVAEGSTRRASSSTRG